MARVSEKETREIVGYFYIILTMRKKDRLLGGDHFCKMGRRLYHSETERTTEERRREAGSCLP